MLDNCSISRNHPPSLLVILKGSHAYSATSLFSYSYSQMRSFLIPRTVLEDVHHVHVQFNSMSGGWDILFSY